MRRIAGSIPSIRARCMQIATLSERHKQMSARENLSALLATRGKGGSLESISQAGKHFSADKTLTPSDFIVDKLEASKAITLLGGYAVSTYGFTPEVAYSMRNVFAKESGKVVGLFDLTQPEFIGSIKEIESEIATREAQKVSLDNALGVDAERYIKNATSQIEKVIDGNISPKVRHDLLTLIALAQSKVEYAPLKVAQNA